MTRFTLVPVAAALVVTVALITGSAVAARAHAGARAGTPRATAASGFSARVTNPWFPLVPGTRYVYVGAKDGEPSRDVVTVTHRTRRIDGVPCAVVEDRLYLSGRLRERTTDWYSQDARGRVWYFGEDTAELDPRGRVASREGSWRAGVDAARPGIFMPAQPRVGRSFRQELYKGHAEDYFRVIGVYRGAVGGRTKNAVLTREWTPLEPGTIDHKLYVRGIGNVLEQTLKGGSERAVLVSLTRGA
jgi:hypothetical protein